jgi:hypothetical protein
MKFAARLFLLAIYPFFVKIFTIATSENMMRPRWVARPSHIAEARSVGTPAFETEIQNKTEEVRYA